MVLYTTDTSSTITYNVAAGNSTYSSPLTNYVFSNNTFQQPSSDLVVQGDINFSGVSLKEMLEKIQDRLLILTPDPTKLEKYEALRAAYENYKLIEKLLKD